MTRVKVTPEEYEYLETFRSKNMAIYYISRFGWNYPLRDGKDSRYSERGAKYSAILGNGDFDTVRDKLIRAVLDGYELDEPLYTVRIPDPYGTFKYRFLKRDEKSNIYIAGCDDSCWVTWDNCQLTKQEIIDYFEWAWKFARIVRED